MPMKTEALQPRGRGEGRGPVGESRSSVPDMGGAYRLTPHFDAGRPADSHPDPEGAAGGESRRW